MPADSRTLSGPAAAWMVQEAWQSAEGSLHENLAPAGGEKVSAVHAPTEQLIQEGGKRARDASPAGGIQNQRYG